jgi:vacuolar-type H+-ATPase subunit I/STV1
MKALALLFGFALVALGLVTLVVPEVLIDVARHFATPVGLWVAAVLRVALGLLLVHVAPSSRMPLVLRVIGAMSFLAGLVTPLIGVDRARTYVEWWAERGSLAFRGWALIAIALGGFILWALFPQRQRRELRPA